MSLKNELEYEHFKSLMVLDKKGTDRDYQPYWVTKQPWIKDRKMMVDNKSAVIGIMNSTLRKLNKNPKWREIYEGQLLAVLERGQAREVSESKLNDWIESGGKT